MHNARSAGDRPQEASCGKATEQPVDPDLPCKSREKRAELRAAYHSTLELHHNKDKVAVTVYVIVLNCYRRHPEVH